MKTVTTLGQDDPTKHWINQMQEGGIKAPYTHRLPAVGACIYCGAVNTRLTEEHIIPKGLGGTIVLPEASCDECAKITSLVELKVMRGFMDRGRQAMGIKGRKQHKRLREEAITQVFIRPDNSSFEQSVPMDQAIRVMHLPVLPLPGFLDPLAPPSPAANRVDVVALDTLHFGLDQAPILQSRSAVGVQIHEKMDVWAFARMLAKIAHGYHVAIRGMFPLEESPLVPIILGTRRDVRNWVGCIEQHPLPSDRPALHLLHEAPMEGDDRSECIAVRIKLFAAQGTATYVLATRIREVSQSEQGPDS